MSKTTKAVVASASLAALTGGIGGYFGAMAAFSWSAAAWAGASTLVLGAVSAHMAEKTRQRDRSGMEGRMQSVRQSAGPHEIVFGQVRKGGTFALMETTGKNNKVFHLILMLAAHRVKSIGAVYFDGELALNAAGLPQPPWSSVVTVEKRLGSDAQSAISIPELGDTWTTAHRLRGIAHIYLRLEYNVDAFPNGLPNITVDIEGYDQVHDPRLGVAGYSRNAALCLAAYLTNSRWGMGFDPGSIDEDALIAAANVCDELVAIDHQRSEPRYCCDGLIRSDEVPRDIIENLLTAMAGEAVYSGGLWRIYAGAYREPDVVLGPDDARGPVSLRTRVSRRENFNGVRGTFVSPENDWQVTDFPAWASEVYLAEDGERVWKDISLPFTISATAAQRLAKIDLERARRQMTLELPAALPGIMAQAGTTVAIDLPRFGFAAKPFEVRELAFADNDDAMGVDLVLREISPLVYDWEASEAEIIEAAPRTNLPSPRDVPQPVAPTVTEELYATRGVGVKVRVILDWGGSELDFVDRFQVEYREHGSGWQRVPSTEATRIEINDFSPGIYDFRVRALNRLGVASPWVPRSNVTIEGASGIPSPVTGFTVQAVGGMAILRWDQHPDLDVRHGGTIVIRHARQLSGAQWTSAVSIGREIPGEATHTVLPLKPGSYLAKARDALGQLSDEPAVAVTTGGTVLNYSTIAMIQEHPAWAGQKHNVQEDAGGLALSPGELYGTYRCAAGIDLGSVRPCRLQTDLDVATISLGLTIDARLEPIDQWADFDGAADGDTDVQVWVRTTNDDPNAAPVWSDWQRLDSAEYRARAFDFELRLISTDDDYSVRVNELTIRADEVSM